MKKRPLIYYAHPYRMRGSEEEKHHIKVLEEKGFEVYDPFIGEGDVEKRHGGPYYSNPTIEFARELVEKDLEMVEKCDWLIAIMVGSTGTAMELMYAWTLGKKIISIDSRHHPFPMVLSDYLYETFEEFEKNFELEKLSPREFVKKSMKEFHPVYEKLKEN
ncbi:MAG: nucleoside 2-deoxyribosyltransferase [Candidatus Helarchaeales archaeon]